MSNKRISMMNSSSSFGAKKRGAEGGSQQAGVQMDTDREQAGPSSKEVTVPPKKPKMSGPKSSRKHSTSGSSSLVPTKSTQPGGAAGPQPGGAAGPQPGGGAGPQPGGGAGPQPGGGAGPQPGGGAGPQPGGGAGPQPGGAAGPQPGGGAGPQPGGGAGPQTFKCNQRKVKEENDGDPMGKHSHRFTVKLSATDSKKHNITCNRPRTVLKAIKSTQTYNKGMEMEMCADENIVIQLGKEDKASIVATHFPCTCIREGESLIISHKSDIVEAAEDKLYNPIQSRDKYSVFYIETEGGENTKTKRLFRNTAVKQFKYLCVYGKKGMTVEEALKRDGRFIDDLGDFKLSDNKNPSRTFENTEKVDTLDRKKLKLCLPRKKKTKGQPADQQANQYTPQSSPAAWYCHLC